MLNFFSLLSSHRTASSVQKVTVISASSHRASVLANHAIGGCRGQGRGGRMSPAMPASFDGMVQCGLQPHSWAVFSTQGHRRRLQEQGSHGAFVEQQSIGEGHQNQGQTKMGSFTLSPKLGNGDKQDNDLKLDADDLTRDDLLTFCQKSLSHFPPLLRRHFRKRIDTSYGHSMHLLSSLFSTLDCNTTTASLTASTIVAASNASSLSSGVDASIGSKEAGQRITSDQSTFTATSGLSSSSGITTSVESLLTSSSPSATEESTFRVLQWNVLSQALGENNDNFVCCPDSALDWSTRKYRMLEEILTYQPDIICLQEVDHFHFLETVLKTQQYEGLFLPKPDSPCLYIANNNGSDGCAVFYNRKKFSLISSKQKVVEVWRVESNQVVLMLTLRHLETGQEICVATTHLKARQGALLSTLRNEQGKDIIQFIKQEATAGDVDRLRAVDNGDTAPGRRRSYDYNSATTTTKPVILCGDFNAEPNEPVYSTILSDRVLSLQSAYRQLYGGREPAYTTWKVREEGEICHTIDYIFCSRDHFDVVSALDFPDEVQIGEGRVPSLTYPSDHFSLVCDLRIKVNNNSQRASMGLS